MPARDVLSCDPLGRLDGPGLARLVKVGVLYVIALAIATYPSIVTMGTHLPPGFADPLIHIWTMRWYRTCLVEWQSPFLCGDVLYPLGAPLGYLPPLALQTALFLPLSLVTSNDVLIFNVIWWLALLTTGLGVYVLAWALLKDHPSAFLAGLLGMLSGPVLFFARGEIEQVTLVGFPLFLLAWIRLIDAPSRGRLGWALGGFTLLAAGAPYHVVLGGLPAVLYVAMGVLRRGGLGWLRERAGWLAAFCGLALVVLPLLFATQVWAVVQGYPIRRSDSQFIMFSASVWRYLFPWSEQSLMSSVLPNFQNVRGVGNRVPSYLGLVTLGLLVYAGVKRVSLPRGGFWWACLAMLFVLSLGAYWTVGSHEIPLPAYWIRKYGLIFGPIRVPGRFNLFAAICAAVLAGAGFKHLRARIVLPRRRVLATAALTAVAVADLAVVPYGTVAVPPTPSYYQRIDRTEPPLALLEAPYPAFKLEYSSLCSLWQSAHGARTSAGYTAVDHTPLAELTNFSSPFHSGRIMDPRYLSDPEHLNIDLVRDVRFQDYVWLYLNRFGFDRLALHKEPMAYPSPPASMPQVAAALEGAKTYEDDQAILYDVALLERPRRPVLLCTEGWRSRVVRQGKLSGITPREARIVVYNPDPEVPLRLRLEAEAYREPRTVRLLRDGVELARWRIVPRTAQAVESPPFELPAGSSELVLVCDSESSPAKPAYAPVEGDQRPFSLWVTGVGLEVMPRRVAGGRPDDDEGGRL